MSGQTFIFGEWDAPVTDDAIPIDVPTDRPCTYCREQFREGDNGAVMPSGLATHRECQLRAVLGGIGHHVDHMRYCIQDGDPDAGLGYRRSALLVWTSLTTGVRFTEEDLEAARATPT